MLKPKDVSCWKHGTRQHHAWAVPWRMLHCRSTHVLLHHCCRTPTETAAEQTQCPAAIPASSCWGGGLSVHSFLLAAGHTIRVTVGCMPHPQHAALLESVRLDNASSDIQGQGRRAA
jgi:hypothetical protein